MQKILQRYKSIPSEEAFTNFAWYVTFVQVISNIQKIEHILRTYQSQYCLWAPYYQEYCKTYYSELVLVDRLLYPGYIFVGLQDIHKFDLLNNDMHILHLGYMLGNYASTLSQDDLSIIRSVSAVIVEEPAGQFKIREGDHIVISSGPCSGLHGVVRTIQKDGQVKLSVFFMNREISVDTTITNIQGLNEIVK